MPPLAAAWAVGMLHPTLAVPAVVTAGSCMAYARLSAGHLKESTEPWAVPCFLSD